MNKRLIRVDGDDFTGWCCSHCPWDMITLRANVLGLIYFAWLYFRKLKHNVVRKQVPLQP